MNMGAIGGSDPIGASVIQFLGPGNVTASQSSQEQSTSSREIASQKIPECPLLFQKSNGGRQPQRILVQGPLKSGKSSFAMNLACSVAASNRCHCSNHHHHQHPRYCQCVSSIIYRYSTKEEEGFPLPCKPYQLPQETMNDNKSLDDFTTRYRRMDTTQASSTATECWDVGVLKRVQIRYVSTIRELLKDLLSILGRPSHQQPNGSIIVDDLDYIASFDNNPPMSMMKTMAILIDSSTAICRNNPRASPIITMATSRSKIMAPWIDSIVHLRSMPQSASRTSPLASNIHLSLWKATMNELHSSDGDLLAREWDYSVTKTPEQGLEIRWLMTLDNESSSNVSQQQQELV